MIFAVVAAMIFVSGLGILIGFELGIRTAARSGQENRTKKSAYVFRPSGGSDEGVALAATLCGLARMGLHIETKKGVVRISGKGKSVGDLSIATRHDMRQAVLRRYPAATVVFEEEEEAGR